MVRKEEGRRKFPLMNGSRFYITTSITYANAPPHIGFALEEVQADVIARSHRLKGDEVLFLTGTDEHGMKIVRAASSAGRTPEEFVDENAKRLMSLKAPLNLSWDDFIRTTDRSRHWPGAKLMWEKLTAAGDIYKKSYRGLYCVGHEAFVTQKDLVDGKCSDHGTEPETVEEENYFFRLSRYSGEIKKKIENGELEIVPHTRKNEILSLIGKNGLEDVSFSRPAKDLSWGIPVPGDSSQTMYVWCDALANYLSAIGYGRNEEYKEWWPANVQVIGKDILRFHAAIWPGMLLSAGLPLPKKIFVHGFITVNGEKMSKTKGNVVDPAELAGKYGADAVRYYLLREISPTEDGDFSAAKFVERYNADLANGLGNFVSRVLTLGAGLGKIRGGLNPDSSIVEEVEMVKKTVQKKVSELKFNEALSAAWSLISFGDGYINESAPWNIENYEKREEVIFNLVVMVDNLAAMLRPFLPQTSEKIAGFINWEDGDLKVKKPDVLFPRVK